MKIGLFNKEEILNSAGEFVGYNIGYDYASEHEGGLHGIREAFGISQQKKNAFMRLASRIIEKKPAFGLKARCATKTPEGIFFKEGEYYSIGYSTDFVNMEYYVKDTETKLAWPGRKEAFLGRWDENGFVFCTKNKEHYDALKAAFERNDIAFYLGARGFLSAGGLHIVIPSLVDPEVDQVMIAMDEENYRLGKTADATGIETELLKASKKFYALTPGWKNEEKTEVWFWLNPIPRALHSGWYTIEELKEWIADKGPVVEGRKEETVSTEKQ
jgi:hypothetical protein